MEGEEQDLETQIMELFRRKNKMLSSRDVAKGLGLQHSQVKLILTRLINAGTLEFVSFGGATFIQLPK